MMKKTLIILFLFFYFPVNAVEKETNFSIANFEKAQASGKTIVINSYEIWSGTCTAQTKVLNQAKKDFSDIIFLSFEQTVDKDIAKKFGIDYWTTIVVYKNNKEVHRSIGQTNKAKIYELIKS